MRDLFSQATHSKWIMSPTKLKQQRQASLQASIDMIKKAQKQEHTLQLKNNRRFELTTNYITLEDQLAFLSFFEVFGLI